MNTDQPGGAVGGFVMATPGGAAPERSRAPAPGSTRGRGAPMEILGRDAARAVGGVAPMGAAMRLVIDSLIALMLVGILAAVIVSHRRAADAHRKRAQVRAALADLQRQALYHAALLRAAAAEDGPDPRPGAQGFPRAIDPAWFRGHRPTNPLLAPPHPWLDLAPPGDHHANPPNPVAKSRAAAGFWYNPARGIFRARVPPQGTDRATLDLYNRLNATSVRTLHPEPAPGSDRAPLAYDPGQPAPAAPHPPRAAAPAAGATAAPPRPHPTLADLPRKPGRGQAKKGGG